MPDFQKFAEENPAGSNPNPLVVEIDLGKLGLVSYDEDGEPTGPADLREQIIERAAHKLLTEWDYDSKRAFRELVHQIRDEEIRSHLAVVIRTALSEPIQRTSTWGEKRGEPVTVLDLIREELGKFLGGTTPTRDTFGGDKGPKNLADLIAVIAKEAMGQEFSKEIREAKAAVTEQVTQIATEAAAQLLQGKRAR